VWLRRGAQASVALLGVASLIGFAIALTRVDSPFAGRAYAAYGGVYVASSLGWLWVIERQRPTVADIVGAAVAVAGAAIIIAFGSRGVNRIVYSDEDDVGCQPTAVLHDDTAYRLTAAPSHSTGHPAHCVLCHWLPFVIGRTPYELAR